MAVTSAKRPVPAPATPPPAAPPPVAPAQAPAIPWAGQAGQIGVKTGRMSAEGYKMAVEAQARSTPMYQGGPLPPLKQPSVPLYTPPPPEPDPDAEPAEPKPARPSASWSTPNSAWAVIGSRPNPHPVEALARSPLRPAHMAVHETVNALGIEDPVRAAGVTGALQNHLVLELAAGRQPTPTEMTTAAKQILEKGAVR